MRYFENEILSVYYDLIINGKSQDDLLAFISSYKLSYIEDGAALLTFEVNDIDWVFVQDSVIIEDAKVKFRCGYSNDMTDLIQFEGYISIVDVNFSNLATPIVTVTCMDETHAMNREKKNRTFSKMKRSAIATKIFKEYGFKTDVQDSGELPSEIETITQSKETDIQFLQRLAKDVNPQYFICYLEKGVGHFKKRDISPKPSDTLHLKNDKGNDINNFSCSINKEQIKVLVKHQNIGNDKKKTTDAVSSPSKDTKTSTGQGDTKESTPVTSPTYSMDSKTGVWNENK